jgi:hypothetical protein
MVTYKASAPMKAKHSVFLDYARTLRQRKRLVLYCLGGVML